MENLLNFNRGPSDIEPSLTVILIDATGSMSGVIESTKQTVGKMISRAKEILKNN